MPAFTATSATYHSSVSQPYVSIYLYVLHTYPHMMSLCPRAYMHNATTVGDLAAPSLDHVCPTRKPPQPWLRHATPSLPRQLRLHTAVAADHSQRSHRDLRWAPHTATTVAVSFSALTATTMADLHHTTSWPLAQCPARALDATTVADSRTGWPQRQRRAR